MGSVSKLTSKLAPVLAFMYSNIYTKSKDTKLSLLFAIHWYAYPRGDFMKRDKTNTTLICCGLASILFLIFLFKGMLSYALFLLLLILNVLIGELLLISKDKSTSACCYAILLLLSAATGVYYLVSGNAVLGGLSFLAPVLPSFRFAASRKE